MTVLAPLAPLRAHAGQRLTTGLDDASIERLAAHHPDLGAAMAAAAAEYARVHEAAADLLELDEAALMDGATRTQILVRIIAPLCRPAIVTGVIFGFITAWNEFLFGLMLTTSKAVPITVGASFFFAASGGGVQWGVASAVMIVVFKSSSTPA